MQSSNERIKDALYFIEENCYRNFKPWLEDEKVWIEEQGLTRMDDCIANGRIDILEQFIECLDTLHWILKGGNQR